MTNHNDVPNPPDPKKTPSGLSPEEAAAWITRRDPRFTLTQAVVRGVRYKVFANAPGNLRELLQEAAAAYGTSDLLVYRDQRWDYPAFCNEVNQLACALTWELGVQPGDRVALAMRNYPEMAVLIMAVVSIGAVVVPMNSWWSHDELVFALKDCEARVVFADAPRHGTVRAHASSHNLTLIGVRDAVALPNYQSLRYKASHGEWPQVPIAPDDDFAVLYSSGSSGRPKGVVLTHRGAISTIHSWLMGKAMLSLINGPDAIPVPAPPSALIVTPLFHVTALHALFLQGLATGSKMSLMYKWDPEEALRIINAEKVTRFVGVPTQSAELMEAARRLGEPLPSLESIGAGGAKRPSAQVAQLADAFPDAMIASGWGMTETNSLGIIVSGPDYLARPETAGRLTQPLQEARIVEDQDKAVASGQIGELIVKSPANMRCYLNLPEATRSALKEGWLYTGDLARMDNDGFIYIVDRKKTIIIRGGENISCLEVEGALHHHPDVAEACVFPVPDERLGETVGAAVYLKPGARATEAQLRERVAEHIAGFKVPGRVWFWPQPLPRGGTDKLNRRALQAECLALAGIDTDHV